MIVSSDLALVGAVPTKRTVDGQHLVRSSRYRTAAGFLVATALYDRFCMHDTGTMPIAVGKSGLEGGYMPRYACLVCLRNEVLFVLPKRRENLIKVSRLAPAASRECHAIHGLRRTCPNLPSRYRM